MSPFADWVASPPRRAYYFLLPTRSERASAQSESLNINAVDPDIVAPELDKFIETVKENGATNLGAGLPFYTSFQRSTCRT